MTLTTYQYDAVAEPHAAAASAFFAARAFRAVRAWRAWAARTRDFPTSGFILLRAGLRRS